MNSQRKSTVHNFMKHSQKKRMKKDESVQEYFINMKEIASRGIIEDTASIQYTIDGIYDSPNGLMH